MYISAITKLTPAQSTALRTLRDKDVTETLAKRMVGGGHCVWDGFKNPTTILVRAYPADIEAFLAEHPGATVEEALSADGTEYELPDPQDAEKTIKPYPRVKARFLALMPDIPDKRDAEGNVTSYKRPADIDEVQAVSIAGQAPRRNKAVAVELPIRPR